MINTSESQTNSFLKGVLPNLSDPKPITRTIQSWSFKSQLQLTTCLGREWELLVKNDKWSPSSFTLFQYEDWPLSHWSRSSFLGFWPDFNVNPHLHRTPVTVLTDIVVLRPVRSLKVVKKKLVLQEDFLPSECSVILDYLLNTSLSPDPVWISIHHEQKETGSWGVTEDSRKRTKGKGVHAKPVVFAMVLTKVAVMDSWGLSVRDATLE